MVKVWSRAAAVAVLSLAAQVASAGESPLAPVPIIPNDCDPCPPACPIVCPTKSPKLACKDGSPKKIIVHQAEPIVEFRNDGPSRPVVTDRNVRPVGGDCLSCNGHGGQGAGYPHKIKTVYNLGGGGHGWGCNKGHHGGAVGYQMVPTMVQMQAFVPQAVTFAAPMTFAAPGFAAPGFATNSSLFNALSAADDRPPARDSGAALQAAQAAQAATASFETRIRSLETKMVSIESRLSAIERGIDVLCEERAKVRQ